MNSRYVILLLVACVLARSVEGNWDVHEENMDNGVDDSNDKQDSGVSHGPETPKVAFSAYLSSDTSLGSGQHIKFDKVLLNDGGAYEASTGEFRAKVSGVYMFTYVVGQRNENEFEAKLVYDGKSINGAIAEGMHKYHDAQGTNTAMIHVGRGKAVWVAAYSNGQLQGNTGHSYTTFTGFLLYEKN